MPAPRAPQHATAKSTVFLNLPKVFFSVAASVDCSRREDIETEPARFLEVRLGVATWRSSDNPPRMIPSAVANTKRQRATIQEAIATVPTHKPGAER